jgi:hypothetical protein
MHSGSNRSLGGFARATLFGVETIRKQTVRWPSTRRQPARFLVRARSEEKVGVHRLAIGALADIPAFVRREKGTILSKEFEGLTWL